MTTWGKIVRQFGGTNNTARAQECWEALVARGLLHENFLRAPEREFATYCWDKNTTYLMRHRQSFPVMVGDCVAVAANARRLLSLEQFVRGKDLSRQVCWFATRPFSLGRAGEVTMDYQDGVRIAVMFYRLPHWQLIEEAVPQWEAA